MVAEHDWSLPYACFMRFIFFRFAVVVQNSGGISQFYATIETDVLHRKMQIVYICSQKFQAKNFLSDTVQTLMHYMITDMYSLTTIYLRLKLYVH